MVEKIPTLVIPSGDILFYYVRRVKRRKNKRTKSESHSSFPFFLSQLATCAAGAPLLIVEEEETRVLHTSPFLAYS